MRKPGKLVSEHYATDRSTSANLVTTAAASDRDKTTAKGRCAALTANRYTYDRAIASYRQVMNDVMHNRPVI
jgi:hypothetical protein